MKYQIILFDVIKLKTGYDELFYESKFVLRAELIRAYYPRISDLAVDDE